jgi:hypothetical protein
MTPNKTVWGARKVQNVPGQIYHNSTIKSETTLSSWIFRMPLIVIAFWEMKELLYLILVLITARKTVFVAVFGILLARCLYFAVILYALKTSFARSEIISRRSMLFGAGVLIIESYVYYYILTHMRWES